MCIHYCSMGCAARLQDDIEAMLLQHLLHDPNAIFNIMHLSHDLQHMIAVASMSMQQLVSTDHQYIKRWT